MELSGGFSVMLSEARHPMYLRPPVPGILRSRCVAQNDNHESRREFRRRDTSDSSVAQRS